VLALSVEYCIRIWYIEIFTEHHQFSRTLLACWLYQEMVKETSHQNEMGCRKKTFMLYSGWRMSISLRIHRYKSTCTKGQENPQEQVYRATLAIRQ
jgi:hypothetical protein